MSNKKIRKKICFFGIPSSEGALGKNNGCEDAPKCLSKLFGVNSEEFILSKNDVEADQEELFIQAKKSISSCKGASFFFGGTHDITFSTFKAFSEVNSNSSLLIFDAHADCDEGVSTPSHEDFVRALVNQKIVLPQNILLFGLRKVYPSEKGFLKESGVKQIYLKEINSNPLKAKKELSEFVNASKNLYVSFDVDVIDSNLMKATGYVHKGGLSAVQTKNYLSEVFAKAKAFDLVEFNPKKGKLSEEKLLKKLFSELI